MNLRIVSTAMVVACALALPTTPASAVPNTTSVAVGVSSVASPGMLLQAATKKPKAVVSATFTTLPKGKVVLLVTSNATKVQVKYRTAKNKKRALNKKLKRGTATITLPAGSKTITVRAKATSKLATSPWATATPPVVVPVAPPAPPVVTPPVVRPVAPPVVSTPVEPPVTPPVDPPVDTTSPGPVTGLAVTTTTPTSISLTWTNPTDADLAAVIVSRNGTTTPVYEGLAGTFTDTGLTPDTSYLYLVYARDASGNRPAASSWTRIEATTSPAVGSTGPVEVTLVSKTTDGVPAIGNPEELAVSADGRFVAFSSIANNLVPQDTNDAWDVFVHDRQTGITTRVSVATDGTQGNGSSIYPPTMSADGRFVAFASQADNLITGDTNGAADVFVHDRQTGATTRVSVATDGTQGNGFDSVISADGRYVSFVSGADTIVTGDTNGTEDVFVHDRQTGTTTRVSVATDGTQGDGRSHFPAISGEGRYVSFVSYAGNLVAGDTNDALDVFVHDLQTQATTRVSVASGGTQANSDSDDRTAISADGRFVAFASYAGNLVPNDTNDAQDVFVRDRQTGTTTRVSVATDGTQPLAGDSEDVAISADGRFVGFVSRAANLVAGDTNTRADVFVHDQVTGTTTRVSVSATGTQALQRSYEPALSAEGRFIVFGSFSQLDPLASAPGAFVARMW